ncbi:MAG: class I SAM-dependent methyltransferase [Clostridia bacterium]|jgi:tRNA (adenine22-N1)-methyltransferase
MELKGRLALIASKVQKANIVADIGTDHAYIPIFLVENGVCKSVIASDVRKGPLKAAKLNIKNAGFEDKIETLMGDGLETISENKADVIIIAGMGGILISKILTEGKAMAKSAKSLILQPMNRLDEVRKWLTENDFEIYDEELCAEGEKIYNVICAKHFSQADIKKHKEKKNNENNKNNNKSGNRNSTGNSISEAAYLFIGKKLIEKKDPLLGKMLKNKIRQLDKAIKEMKNSSSNGNVMKNDSDSVNETKRNESRDEYIELRDDLKRIENMIE